MNLEGFHRRVTCRLLGHRWRNRVGGGSLCGRCYLWQARRVL